MTTKTVISAVITHTRTKVTDGTDVNALPYRLYLWKHKNCANCVIDIVAFVEIKKKKNETDYLKIY